jgi:hypothetical protein
MKYLKLAFISVIVFGVIVTFISFFFPSNVRISKAVDIQVQKDSLMAVLGDPSRWKEWYPGADTFRLVSQQGLPVFRLNEKGAVLEVVGRSDSSIELSATGPGVKDMKSGWNIHSAPVPRTQTVQWYLDFRLRWYPWEKFSSITFEKRYGPYLEQGLEKLKKMLER